MCEDDPALSSAVFSSNMRHEDKYGEKKSNTKYVWRVPFPEMVINRRCYDECNDASADSQSEVIEHGRLDAGCAARKKPESCRRKDHASSYEKCRYEERERFIDMSMSCFHRISEDGERENDTG